MRIIFILIVLLLALSAQPISPAEEVRVAVLLSHDALPYSSALEGFRENLSASKASVRYDIYPLKGDVSKAAQAVEDIKKKNYHLIYSLGTLAADTVLEKITDVPVITGLTMGTDKLSKSLNATGVVLDFSVRTQFEIMKRFLPEVKTVGTIYGYSQIQQMIDTAGHVAKEMNFRLEVRKISSPGEIPAALDAISNKADVFWGINDNMVFTPETAKHILLFSYRNRIPFIGLSSEWVKAGALYSLDRDYKSIGAQCGEMALKILSGSSVSSIPVAAPRTVIYSLNLKTAEHMKINFPETVVKNAFKIY
ncbi:MAG: ABC transporter substrate-binding protein [Nitrospirae bacterium]|nr:ABC transporter substrate-binding protein [Nitrospirota bacterium]